jgi:branched-chain amino acid transport system permease protein
LITDLVRAYRYGPAVSSFLAVGATFVAPHIFSRFTILQITVFLVGAILAESIGLVWGFGGIMCFGQTAFFGLGGYAYAISVENLGDSTIPIIIAILAASSAACALGVFLFFGKLGDVYVGVVTLCISLILYDFGNSTQDRFYTIGTAALNGFNGMAGVPGINLPFHPSIPLDTVGTFYLCAGSLIGIYLFCKGLLALPFGRIAVAVKQNEVSVGLIGYNASAIKLVLFTIGGGIAGYAGCLYVNWNGYISPSVFGLPMMGQTIIWVVVGGLGTLLGPIFGAIALQYLATVMGNIGLINVELVFGLVLVAVVVFLPEGVIPTLARLARSAASLAASSRPQGSGRQPEGTRPSPAAD